MPTPAELDGLNYAYEKFDRMVKMRSRNYNYFGGNRDLVAFVDDSDKRFNGYIPPRDDLQMDWQARVFLNFTQQQVVTYLAKTALNRLKPKITATNTEGFFDLKKGHALEKTYDYIQNRQDGKMKFFWSSLEAVVKGTTISYIGYKKTKRKVKEIRKYDPLTGIIDASEREIIDYDDVWQETVPLNDFFVENIFQPNVQDQPSVVWRSIAHINEAQSEFRKYKNWSKVKAGTFPTAIERLPFFKDNIYSTLAPDQVEILRLFCKRDDRHLIIVNGVVLYDGPFPFKHKMYPFTKAIYEPFGSQFFYGNSLPNKIATQQDVLNTLWNMGLDQQFMAIFKPILTDDPDEVEDTVLVPGLIRKVGDINKYRVMNELQGPDASFFNMLQMAQKFIQEGSGQIPGGGSASSASGAAVTARQAMMLEERSRELLGLNSWMFEHYEADTCLLTLKTALQFMSQSSKVMFMAGNEAVNTWEQKFVKVMRVDDTELSDGSYGATVIRVAKSEKVLPTPGELDIEEEAAEMQGQNLEIVAVTADYIRNVEFDVQVIPQSQFKQTQSMRQAQAIEAFQLFGQHPLVNQEENLRNVMEALELDPDKLINKQQPQMMTPPGATPELSSQILGRGEEKSLAGVMGMKL